MAVGVLTEQGYFGEGFGFKEATEEEQQKVLKDTLKDDKKKDDKE